MHAWVALHIDAAAVASCACPPQPIRARIEKEPSTASFFSADGERLIAVLMDQNESRRLVAAKGAYGYGSLRLVHRLAPKLVLTWREAA